MCVQGIQITGLDMGSLGQTFQIDASLLQQLQAGLNIAVNPGHISVPDTSLVHNLPNIQVRSCFTPSCSYKLWCSSTGGGQTGTQCCFTPSCSYESYQ